MTPPRGPLRFLIPLVLLGSFPIVTGAGKLGTGLLHGHEIAAVTAAAAALEPGRSGDWSAASFWPWGSTATGRLAVLRAAGTAEFACRDVAYSIDGGRPDLFSVTLCRPGLSASWTVLESAGPRWGG